MYGIWRNIMKYYLVALFDKDSYLFVENIQKNICKKYKLYRKLPVLHITLEVIDDPDVDKLDKIVSDILKPYKRFRVELNGVICFDPPYKSVNLKVENKGYITRLIRQINEKLRINHLKARENIDNWDLHVSLANTNYASRKWSTSEYKIACENTRDSNPQKVARIDRLELWKPINNKKTMTVKSFLLKEY
jgi:2'-5' RNA ligase